MVTAADIQASGALGIIGNGVGIETATAGTTVTLAAGAGGWRTGALLAGGDVQLSADGAIRVGDVDGGALTATAGTSLAIGDVDSVGGLILLSGADLDLGDLVAGGGISVASGADLLAGDIAAGGDVRLNAVGAMDPGLVTTPALVAIDAGLSLAASSITGLAGVSLRSGGIMRIAGAVRSNGMIEIESGEDVEADAVDGKAGVTLSAAGNVVLGNLVSEAVRLDIAALGGQLTVGNIDAAGVLGLRGDTGLRTGNLAANGLILVSGGDISSGSLAAGTGSLEVLAAGTVTTGGGGAAGDASGVGGGDLTLGGAGAANGLRVVTSGGFTAAAMLAVGSRRVEAGGGARFAGAVSGDDLQVQSAAIDIAAGFGTASTRRIAFIIDPAATARQIGGMPSPGWSLDASEMTRLRAADISVSAPSTGAGVLRIDDFTLVGSAGTNPNLTGSSFSVDSGRPIEVVGAAIINSAGSEDILRLVANEIRVISDAGGQLAVLAGDVPGGLLSLEARNIFVGDAALVTDLVADINFAGRNDRLNGAPAAEVPNRHELIGGTIDVTVSNAFLVQNTDRGTGFALVPSGFDAGTGGLIVTSTGDGVATVVINGQARDAAGLPITKEFVLETVTFRTQGGGFGGGSTVNACVFGTQCLQALETLAPAIEPIGTQVQAIMSDEEEEQIERAVAGAATDPTPEVRQQQLLGDRELTRPQLINEPMTGVGNIGQFVGAGRA
ncbi:beta strand repeat-containing protein, partial [Polymorphobacter multimanifer]|uniref:beta strand repeat-containing protein n=1 Tax=Polymorphobacter multimanifer TaxID=1070431 RepID=UPI001A9CA7A5